MRIIRFEKTKFYLILTFRVKYIYVRKCLTKKSKKNKDSMIANNSY